MIRFFVRFVGANDGNDCNDFAVVNNNRLCGDVPFDTVDAEERWDDGVDGIVDGDDNDDGDDGDDDSDGNGDDITDAQMQ